MRESIAMAVDWHFVTRTDRDWTGHARRYEKAVGALHKARLLLERLPPMSSTPSAPDVLAAMARDVKGMTDEARAWQPRHGHPRNWAVPPGLVRSLAAIYEDATGLKPGKGTGRFSRFVLEVMSMIGSTIREATVINAIKAALRQNPHAAEIDAVL